MRPADAPPVPRAAAQPFLLLLSKKAMLYARFTNKTTKI
jgi:hypothetical protein